MPLKTVEKALKLVDETIDTIQNNTANKSEKYDPDFKPDINKGEGKASKLEIEYRSKIKGLYEPVNDVIIKIKDNEITPKEWEDKFNKAVDTYITKAQEAVEKYIPLIWDEKKSIGLKKLKELEIKPVDNKLSPEIMDALIEWQKYAVKKNAEILRLNILNKVYGKTYFVKAYASDKEGS